jgi:5-methylcytosine-specific restriction protein B
MILRSKEPEFNSLFAEFAKGFLRTPEGEDHLRFYDDGRSRGRANFDAMKAAEIAGEDITDRVLQGLLPHTNSAAHRASGAWVHIAPTIQGDIKEWFEGAGWTRAEDWPKVAQAIFCFVANCENKPASLEIACADFAALPYTKGLQTGQLTPIFDRRGDELAPTLRAHEWLNCRKIRRSVCR